MGLSETNQNHFIDSVACLIRREIEDKIQKASFFAIEADESSDLSINKRYAIIFRYIDPCGYIQECFFNFHNVSADRIANALYNFLDQHLEPFNYKRKLVVQSYDGAAVMTGELNDLHVKIKQKSKQALFVVLSCAQTKFCAFTELQ